jgi:hypothetical protein
VTPVRFRFGHVLLALALLAAVTAAHAHNPDTSYAAVTITGEAVSFRLTYDLFTLQKVAPLDANRDGRITREELTQGLPAIQAFIRGHVAVAINDEDADLGEATGLVWPSEAGDAIAEADYHTANGLIHFTFLRRVPEPCESLLLTFRFEPPLGERHTVLGTLTCGSDQLEVTFTRFEPDYEYVTGLEPPLARNLWRFLRLGIEHLFLGYDHLCFLLALVIASRTRELVMIVTSFTIAHSLSLLLAALDVVRLPPRLVECAIAATIIHVAVQNLRGAPTGRRWALTFGFGLIHGFGFAAVLGEMKLPTQGLVRCLLSFNLGVEVGQLALVGALLPLVAWMRRGPHGRRTMQALSFVLAGFGTLWLADRALGLGLMP